MPTEPQAEHGMADDAMAQIARLRAQVEALMREKVNPAFDDLTDRIETTARDAVAVGRDKADAVAGHVKAQPLTAILIAAAVGFLLGRATR